MQAHTSDVKIVPRRPSMKKKLTEVPSIRKQNTSDSVSSSGKESTTKFRRLSNPQISITDLQRLWEEFQRADIDGGGSLEEDEFVDVFGQILGGGKMDKKQLLQLFMKIDANSDGSVTWDEFTNFTLLEDQGALNMQKIAHACELSIQKFRDHPATVKRYHKDTISSICIGYYPDKFYLTSSHDGTVRFWSPHDLTCYGVLNHVPITKQRDSFFREGDKRSCINFLPLHAKAEERQYGSATNARKKGAYKQGRQKFFSNRQRVNHICYLHKSKVLAIASVDQYVTFYSLEGPIVPIGSTEEFPSQPCFLSYYWYKGDDRTTEREILMVGTDRGRFYAFHLTDGWNKIHISGSINNPFTFFMIQFPRKSLRIPCCRQYCSDPMHFLLRKGENAKPRPGILSFSTSKPHTDRITKIKFIKDIDWVLTSSTDGLIRYIDVEDSRIDDERIFRGHKSGCLDFVWCAAFKLIASCGMSRTILIWDPFSLSILNKLFGHADCVQKLTLNPVANQLISLSVDKVIKVWDIRLNSCVQTILDKSIYRPVDRISQIIFDDASPNAEQTPRLVSASNHLNIWPVKQDLIGKITTSHSASVSTILYNNKFHEVISADESSTIIVWDIYSGKMVFRFRNAHGNSGISAMCFDQNQRRIICGAQNGTVRIFNFSNGQCLNKLHTASEHLRQEVTCIAYATDANQHYDDIYAAVDHRTILTAGWDRRIHVFRDGISDDINQEYSSVFPALNWEINHHTSPTKAKKKFSKSSGGVNGSRRSGGTTMRRVLKLPTKGHSNDILSMAICGNNSVATGGSDGVLCIWGIEIGLLKFQIKINSSPIVDLTYMERSQRLVSASEDGFVRMWNMQDFGMKEEAVVWSPDQDYRTSDDERRKIWNFGNQSVSKHTFVTKLTTDNPRNAYLIAGTSEGGVMVFSCCNLGAILNNLHSSRSSPHEEVYAKAFDPTLIRRRYQKVIHETGDLVFPLSMFRAHTLMVTDIQFVGVPDQIISNIVTRRDEDLVPPGMIVTSSEDKCVSLWRLDGTHIGVFGQDQSWDLNNVSNWMTLPPPLDGDGYHHQNDADEKQNGTMCFACKEVISFTGKLCEKCSAEHDSTAQMDLDKILSSHTDRDLKHLSWNDIETGELSPVPLSHLSFMHRSTKYRHSRRR
eukprot:g153.t1